mmetsp:Transcript_13743/g.26135  ORF Transcript_13743/g.26135 Transcript_13743/m.26135 type:complete len:1356 (+) Transcript_13743:185-4252(+)
MSSENKKESKDSNSASSNSNRHPNRFHSPPVELPSSNAQNFFEEAKITNVEENELRRKFGKFCTKVSAKTTAAQPDDEAYLTLDDFCRMLQYYECATAQHYEAYFHAIDRNHDDRLDFQEFFLGCCAADPSTVHILNSFTGYERSQYIFDFYDTNRSSSLEFDEFARLTADCLSLPTTNPNDEQVKRQAIEKARDLGAVEESGGSTLHFVRIKFKKFYEFIQNERLRGTSRLFRFSKSIIKSRGSHHSRRAQGSSISGGSSTVGSTATGGGGTTPTTAATPSHGGSSGHTPSHAPGHAGDEAPPEEDPPSEREDCEWHAHLLELDKHFDPDGGEPEIGFADADRAEAPPYLALLPPAPQSTLRLEPDPPSSTDARTIARKVLRTLCSHHFDGLLANGAGYPGSEAQFTIATPAQLRSLCNAAVRLLEPEDMVLTGLQPPVKVFGSIHGQLLDLLSHFKWQQAPVEDGDILYTTYVFLGDYVDRGAYGLEVLTLLLSLKVVHPHRVALLRGHHENRHLNYHLGFMQECERRLGPLEGMKVFEHVNRVFEHMSLAAIVGGQILALGPGVLPPSLTRLDQLRRYKKPLVLPHVSQPRPAQPLDRLNEQVLLELFTPAPFLPRELGTVREVTSEQIKVFCSQHKLAAVVRSWQVPAKGFCFECGGRFITISSCVNYCDAPRGNDASILCITKEENSPSLAVRPKVLTAQVAKIHRVLARDVEAADVRQPRWPTQQREATPGRATSGRTVTEDGNGTDAANEAAALVVSERSVSADTDCTLVAFPAFSPGRPPGGLVHRGARGSDSAHGNSASADSPRLRTRYADPAEMGQDWALLTASASGRSSLPERRSLGSRRGSGTTSKGQESKSRSGLSAGKAYADPIMAQVLRQSEDEAGPTPKGVSPERRQLPRTPQGGGGVSGSTTTVSGSGNSPSNTGGSGGTPGAAATAPKPGGAMEGSAHRRSGPSPSDGTRLSLNSTGSGAAAAGTTSPAAASGASTGRESKTVPAGSSATGRSTPQSGGVAASSQDRRNGGNGKAKDTPQALRGSGSRPPGATPSPKASTPSTAGRGNSAAGESRTAGSGSSGNRRMGGDASRGEAGAGGEGRGDAAAGGADGDERAAVLTDPQALSRLLQDNSRVLATNLLPVAPSAFVQMPRAVEQPLVLHLCRLWVEAGLTDKEWTQALHMFETELNDQPRQTKGASGGGTPGGGNSEPREARWTLETFSMWLLKRGRRLRECSQWFRAFDFDQDEMIGIADFLQGLVAAGAPRSAGPNTPCGLCSSLALFRLLDLEKKQNLEVRDLETILSDAQVSIGTDFPMSLQQIAQRTTDFEFFRSSLLPRLQNASAFRLSVFGPPPSL